MTRNIPRLFPVLALLTLAACATQLPIQVAQTPQQQAGALLVMYVPIVESAADIVERTTTPPEVRKAIQAAEAAADPLVNQLETLLEQVTTIEKQVAAGTTTEEKLTAAVNALLAQYNATAPAVASLAKATGGHR